MLSDPTIRLYDGQGVLIASNDNWQDTQKIELEGAGFGCRRPSDSAILATLVPGLYTVAVQGKRNMVGTALLELHRVVRP